MTPFKHFDPVPDVRVQFVNPALPCSGGADSHSCDVTYSVSAALAEDEYIGVGFKGQSWEAKFPIAPYDHNR